MSSEDPSSEQPQRRRLQLKPRDEAAAKKAEEERQASGKPNPFGAAKPREQVIAARTGKTEEEILKENIKNERLRLRLNAEQVEEKKVLEAAVDEIRKQMSDLETESDPDTIKGLELMLQEREAAVDALMDKFAKASLEAAQKGEIMRPSERRQQQQQTQMTSQGSGSYSNTNFGQGYEPTSGGRGNYGGDRRGGRGGGGGYQQYQSGDRPAGGGGGYSKDGYQDRQPREGRSGGYGSGGSYVPAPEPGAGGRSRYNRDAPPGYGQRDGAAEGGGGGGGYNRYGGRGNYGGGRGKGRYGEGRTGSPGAEEDYLPGIPGYGGGGSGRQQSGGAEQAGGWDGHKTQDRY